MAFNNLLIFLILLNNQINNVLSYYSKESKMFMFSLEAIPNQKKSHNRRKLLNIESAPLFEVFFLI